MPHIIKYRVWCKTCQEFEIHNSTQEDFLESERQLQCESCKTIYSPAKISEIPEEKVAIQAKRWADKQAKDLMGFYGKYLGAGLHNNPIADLFKEVDNKTHIEVVESDAGEKRRREVERQHKEEIKQQYRIEKAKYLHVQRNEICLCGSGLKYKKCHWPKFNR